MRWVDRRLESSFSTAVFPAPRPPQISTLPFRRRVFSAFPRVVSIDTIFREAITGRSNLGEVSGTSEPIEIVKSEALRG